VRDVSGILGVRRPSSRRGRRSAATIGACGIALRHQTATHSHDGLRERADVRMARALCAPLCQERWSADLL